jgi:hypothetical protein
LEDPEMSENAKYLDTFPTWLRSFGEDAEKLGSTLEGEGGSEGRASPSPAA